MAQYKGLNITSHRTSTIGVQSKKTVKTVLLFWHSDLLKTIAQVIKIKQELNKNKFL